MKVRAKFNCESVKTFDGGRTEVTLNPITGGSPENDKFFKWTPYGEIKIGTINPDVKFVPGKNYFVDFIEENDN